MMASQDRVDPGIIEDIAGAGRFAAARGWVPATGGNFSARIDDRRIAITRSGAPKGCIGPDDVRAFDLSGPPPAGVSAEAPLHAARYRADPAIGAVLHVHSVAATVLSRVHAAENAILLRGYEMLKVVDGWTTHESEMRLPIFANNQDTAALAIDIERSLDAHGPPAYLLAGHGLYAWGTSMSAALRHLEGLEFLLACHLEERRLT
ncbi:MAG: methylthioribulose 1-phosphate dehydratase [Candidatus Eremiobacteraeota bacterium]|nr:methylthioribulose 1-phosphate dehydratase [Candidatus Eremiobacteraeota bacterium]